MFYTIIIMSRFARSQIYAYNQSEGCNKNILVYKYTNILINGHPAVTEYSCPFQVVASNTLTTSYIPGMRS